MEQCYKVYMHTNNINGKRYVGLTRQEPRLRWNGYEAKTPIGAAFKKYGRENFTSEVLFYNLTKEQAEQTEIACIAYYHSLTTEWGYNVEKGGSARGKVSNGTKDKIRASQRRRWQEDHDGMLAMVSTTEAKAKRRESMALVYAQTDLRERLSAGLVKRWSNPEYKAKMSKRMMENAWNLQPVVCDGVEYQSLSSFARANGLEEPTVSTWLCGKHTMPKEWYDRGLAYKNLPDTRVDRSRAGNYDIRVDGKSFTRMSEACQYLGVSDSTLSRYLSGKRKIPQSLLDRGFSIKKNLR